ncbi:unnamed protein product [Ectocarpus sp. 4 AP-2014]
MRVCPRARNQNLARVVYAKDNSVPATHKSKSRKSVHTSGALLASMDCAKMYPRHLPLLPGKVGRLGFVFGRKCFSCVGAGKNKHKEGRPSKACVYARFSSVIWPLESKPAFFP